MFSKARVGDVIYSMRYGEVRIVEISNSYASYPICVKYGSYLAPDTQWITLDGRQHTGDCMATYYWAKPEIIIPPKPLPELEMDTPVLVRDSEDEEWYPRHFHSFGKDGRICTWIDGRTRHTARSGYTHCFWDEWKLPNEE